MQKLKQTFTLGIEQSNFKLLVFEVVHGLEPYAFYSGNLEQLYQTIFKFFYYKHGYSWQVYLTGHAFYGFFQIWVLDLGCIKLAYFWF